MSEPEPGAGPVVAWQAPVPEPSLGAIEGGSLGAAPGSAFRTSLTRGRAAAALIGVSLALYAADGALSVYGIGLLSDLANVTEAQVVAFDSAVSLVAMITLIIYVGAAIAFLAWIRRVVANVPALGGGTPIATPNWAVGWWFIPIANFFKPYQVVSDVWRRLASSPAAESTGLVVGWWVTYILGSVLGNVYARLPVPETVEAFNARMIFNVVIDLLIIVSGVLVIKVILEVEARSKRRAMAIAAAPAAVVAPGPVAPLPAEPTPAEA